MHRPHLKEVLLPALVVLAVGLTAGQCLASFQFQFTTQDYAIETGYWGVAMFKTVCQNTGTQGDSIVFQAHAESFPRLVRGFLPEGEMLLPTRHALLCSRPA